MEDNEGNMNRDLILLDHVKYLGCGAAVMMCKRMSLFSGDGYQITQGNLTGSLQLVYKLHDKKNG